MGFSILGLGALISAFSGTTLKTEKGMDKAAAHLTSEIQNRAPVDTGHLRNSYGYSVEGRGKRVIAHVGTNVEYAIHQEYGTRYQSGKPHVRPAIEANRGTLVEMMGKDTLTAFVQDVSS